MKKNNKQSGFTLVEMVVAVGLFSIVSVLIAQLFVLFNRAQVRSSLQQQMQSDGRVMMAQIADRIRSASIDYVSYGGAISFPDDTLFLIDEDNVAVTIAQTSIAANCPSAQSTPCLVISEGGADFSPLSSDSFTVDQVQFFIDPSTDPAESGGDNIQPRVTFAIEMNAINSSSIQQVSANLQTTVSSRVYFR
jgi:prepilin-type N-terminal cleavage/methylation domain-containing protein